MNKKNYLFLCFLIVLFTTTGCGTGSSDSANPYIDDLNEKDRPSSPGDRLVTTTQESAGNNCLQGGFLVETGVDRNANSKLDTDEVTSQSYVCNGKRENSNGPQISLVSTSPEPSGDNCAQGGVLFETGIDLNSNSVLDKNEVASTSYLCNGLNGTDGKDGTSQLSLISIVAEPAGDNCPEGGVLLGTGMDLNGNSILDAEEIASSGYICNVTTSVPSDNNSPNPIAEVTYAKLLTNFFSETVSVDGTVNINIALEINSTGYNSDNPLVVKISDDQGYFPTKLYNISDFSSDSVLELVSRPFTEATTVTAQIKVEFCDNTTCDEKVYGTKTVTANITINPRFTSATVLTESIRSTVLVGQSNTLNLELNFDADGFNYFNPLYVMVSDGFQSIQTETFTLYDTSQQVTLAIDTLYLYEIGELNSNLSISVCKDYYCYEALQDTISIPINLTVRNPIVFSVPVEPTLSFSQTILESGTLEYEINLASEDTTSMPFWVKIYDPSGEYFQEKVVGSKYVSNIPIKVALEINPIDATASEARTFHIESKVCMDSSCTTVVSPEPGNTDVTLNVLYPSAEITINESAINVIGKDNTPAVTELSGSWQSNNMGSLSAYLVAMDSDGGSIVDNAALLPQQDSFTLPLELLPQTQMNSFSTDVSFKVCLEISCEHVIGSSANIVAVTYDVNQLAGWTTHQRNAQHNGYVPITLNSDNFAESWTWSRPSSTEPIGGINPVVAQDGKVVLSYDVYFGDALVVMLDEATGDKVWEANLGNMPALNPPAITEGKVWAATTGHEDTKLRAFDFNTGSQLHSSNFGGQWPHFFAPTPINVRLMKIFDVYLEELYAYPLNLLVLHNIVYDPKEVLGNPRSSRGGIHEKHGFLSLV